MFLLSPKLFLISTKSRTNSRHAKTIREDPSLKKCDNRRRNVRNEKRLVSSRDSVSELATRKFVHFLKFPIYKPLYSLCKREHSCLNLRCVGEADENSLRNWRQICPIDASLNNELVCRDIKEPKTEFHVPKASRLSRGRL